MAVMALVLSLRSTVIMWMQTQVMQQHLFDLKTHIIKFSYTCNVLNTRLFNTHCQPEIDLPREMKVEPDLSLVQDESSVRYEWLQSLYISVTKLIQVTLQSAWFFYFYTFPCYITGHLSFNNFFHDFLSHFNDLWSLNMDWISHWIKGLQVVMTWLYKFHVECCLCHTLLFSLYSGTPFIQQRAK